MKKLLATAAFILVCSTPALAETELGQSLSKIDAIENKYQSQATSEINAACAAKWGTNYDMQLYCRNKQMAAFAVFMNWARQDTLLAADPATRPSAMVLTKIIVECGEKWKSATDFSMANYCIEKQVAAYNQLQRR